MQCRIRDLRCKEVVNICDGCRLGYVNDVEVRVPDGQVIAIVVLGPCRFFGMFGRGDEFYIPWENIQRVGADIILIDKHFQRPSPRGLHRGRNLGATFE
ncbi:YlmC/YmxH family sporulation protein [Bengtsoniella intestinalis]|uniref:YlmC/YmxH family sporulation protein n=1 Tax=Bengtsoniella intestinalis TaxID=3073143 RepID=UPI00391F9FCC